MKANILSGGIHVDQRGQLLFNNNFDATQVKRLYILENLREIRAWQAHRVEQRWFSCIEGSFLIRLIEVDNWDHPSRNLPALNFTLYSGVLDVLHIPSGYASSIEALDEKSKLLVLADYKLGDNQDEIRFASDYFE